MLDYRNPYFIGLRTDERALPRLRPQPLGRARSASACTTSRPDADVKECETAWQGWLNGVFNQP